MFTPTHEAPIFNSSSRFDVRGITEEVFEEGTKCEGFDSETTAGKRHLNLA